MRVAITGASGLIGSALARSLAEDGHEAVRLVRRPPRSPDEIEWRPGGGYVDTDRLAGADAVV
ncbi:NAD-dependent epimerase/dehydratase family protein, partial [Streptomonospora algeriensis]